MTIREGLELFLLSRSLRGNTTATINDYRNFLEFFINFLGEDVNLSKLSLFDTIRYHMYLLNNRCLKNVSIRTYLKHLRIFIAYLYSENLISEDFSTKITLPKSEKRQIEILTSYEIKLILDTFDTNTYFGLRNYTIVMLMLDCGLRSSEVTNLKTYNINFENKYIKIYGKGRKERIIPIGLRLCNCLQCYLSMRVENGFMQENFFLSGLGEKITSACIIRIFKNLKVNTGIVRVHAHLLRHTYATNFLLYEFGDIYELSMLLGHNDIKTTEIYVNISNYYKIMEKKNKNRSYIDKFEF